MPGFDNPYLETREKSSGETTQEWAQLFIMTSLLFGASFTDTEKAAIAKVIGAFRREFGNVKWNKILEMVSDRLPDVPPE